MWLFEMTDSNIFSIKKNKRSVLFREVYIAIFTLGTARELNVKG